MISIIIPTLNEETILEKTLQNLRKCTKYKLEIIISDGRSTDKTAEIAKKYADKFLVYDGKTRQTIANARNLGAKDAEGEFLVFLDADVIIPNMDAFFDKMLDFFNKVSNLVAENCFLKILPEFATFSDHFFSTFFNYLFMSQNNIFPIGGASGEFQMIKQSAFAQVGGYREDLPAGEDFDLFRRLRKIGKTKTVMSLAVFHTGRRAHKIGWLKLILTWFTDTVWIFFFNKTRSKVWKEVR